VLEALRAADNDDRDWTHRLIPYDTALEVIADAFGVGRRGAYWHLIDATLLSHVSIVHVSDGGRRIETRLEANHPEPGGDVTWPLLTPYEMRGIVADDGTLHYADELPPGVQAAGDDTLWVGLSEMITYTLGQLTGSADVARMTRLYGDALPYVRGLAAALGARIEECPNPHRGGDPVVSLHFADGQIAALAELAKRAGIEPA
jgi:hypothetical protein